MLCNACQNITFRPTQDLDNGGSVYAVELRRIYEKSSFCGTVTFAHIHLSKLEAIESARKGCHLCNFLLDALRGRGDTAPEAPLSGCDRIILFIPKFETEPFFTISCGAQKGDAFLTRLPDAVAQISDKCTADYENDISTGSSNSLDLARYWLDQCEQHHPKCISRRENDSILPDYVVDVGNSSVPLATPSLVPGNGRKERYATLSYCWGTLPQPAKTTSQNLQSQLERIDLAALPKTLQDAIQIVKALDIRFLWIDALCIIQDSIEHWELQSPRMGSIYRNSTLTISADSGPSAHLGCFVMRNPLAVRPCRFPAEAFKMIEHEDRPWFLCHWGLSRRYRYSSRYSRALQLPRSEVLDTRWPSGQPIEETPRSVLDTRAWVLQEQLFSQRVLTFTPAGVAWKCYSGHFYEDWPTYDTQWPDAPHFYFENPVSNAKIEDWRRYDNWNLTMEQYCTRHLSVRTDRLPALSALAAAFMDSLRAANIKDIYLAGMWARDLAYGLMWVARKSGRPCRPQNSPYIAPSWSWASLEVTKIDFPRHYVQYKCRPLDSFHVLEAICQTQGENPYGRIVSGYLMVRTGIMETRVYDPKHKKPKSANTFEHDRLRRWRDWLCLVGVDSGLVVGMIRLDDPDQPEGPVLCIPTLGKKESPRGVHGKINLYNDLLSASIGELKTTTSGTELDWLMRILDKGQSQRRGELLERMKYAQHQSLKDALMSSGHRFTEEEFTSRYTYEERELYCCLAVVRSGPETYKRVGIAEIWDLDWFDDAAARTVKIV